jgi:biopolymer transport protein ExbD
MAGGLASDDEGDEDEQHEINITPFIDVILVLLIIFMVAAPLSTVDIPVELPVSSAAALPRPEKPLFVTLKSDLALAVGETAVTMEGLARALDDVTHEKRDTRIYLRADKAVPYGEVLRVMDALRTGGYLKVGLVGLEAPAAPDKDPPVVPGRDQAPPQ